MPAAGTTSELYLNENESGQHLGAPPSSPTPTPPPTKVEVSQPVVTKSRMADQKPDGSIRDTSMEALEPGRDLGFRNISDEENTPKPVEAKPEEKPAEATKVEVPPVVEQPKVYAGKYKSVEELEKAYDEAQKLITRQGQEKAELVAKAQATPPPAPAPKTPAQIAEEQAENNRIINDFATNPKEFIEKNLVQRVQTALTAQQVAENWRTNNPDLKEHEVRVAFEATLLAQSDPELARNPAALLTKATDTFRQFTGRLRTEGAKEALTQETRTIPLLSNSAPAAATEHPSTKAPLTADAAFDKHMAMLKEQEQKSHRGLRR
jgi:hypothetical protein